MQLTHPGVSLSLDDLAQKLAGLGPVVRNPFLLRVEIDGYELTIFPDARTIISGTADISTARAVYAKYIGH